ncbi:MAG: GNAT family N-acetyltransferase [Arenicella sp.]
MPLTFRPITDSDRDFLFTLYASTRADEMALVPWSQEQKTEFLEMQFHAQHTFYQEQFGDAEFNLILNGTTTIGRLYVDRRDKEIRIIDIALLPDHRRQGFGKQLLQNLLDEAADSKKPVTIHVEKNNPAMSLYQRLGFEITEDQGVYNLMSWQAK